MEENDEEALKKLYEITNDELVKILIEWHQEYNEFIGEPNTYAGSMYSDIMSCIWDKYKLNELEETIVEENFPEEEEENEQ